MDVSGEGFSYAIPQGWNVTRPNGAVVARRGNDLVSVTVFPLRRAYEPAQFEQLAATLDGVAAELAKAAGAELATKETTTVAATKSRAYRYGGKRIAFVLAGRREYQLFCSPGTTTACDVLFQSFSLS